MDTIKEIIGQHIKSLRETKKMTQNRLGMELDIKQETISRYEKGKIKPSIEVLIKLANYFHTSVDYIVGRTNDRLPLRSSNLITKKEERECRMLHYFKLLSVEKQEHIIRFLEILSHKDFT